MDQFKSAIDPTFAVQSPRGLHWLLIAAGIAATVGGLSAWILLSHLYQRTMQDAERELSNISFVLSTYTENSFRSVELLQNGLVDMVQGMNLQSIEDFNERLSSQMLNQDLRTRVLSLPQVEALFLTNEQGITIASTRAWPQAYFSIADRPHFQMLQMNPQLRSYLAPPAPNVQTGVWNIYLSRRLETADGRFLGIVGIALNLTQYEGFLANIALGKDSSIALWRSDGILMARYPHASEALGQVNAAVQQNLRNMQAEGGKKAIRRAGAVDGRERLITARSIDGYPAAVVMTRSVEDILKLWRRQAAYTIGGVLVLVIGILGGVMLGIRQLRNRDILEQTRTDLRISEEQRRSEVQMAHLAHHDSLTGLANRSLLRTQMDDAMLRAQGGEICALLCLDLDHFKDVNDTLGHPVGDQLLQAVTKRILAEVREEDTVARLGGDEFAVLQTGVRDPRGVATLAQRLVDALGTPFELDGHHVVVGASVGIAVAPDDGHEPTELLRNADMALYRAKAAGRAGYRFFEPEMQAYVQMQRTMQLDMRRAIEAGEFELFFQPQVQMTTRQVSGFEALARWHHPERGLILPERFIPLAEETGLIVPLGEWAMQQACIMAAKWPGQEKVAVNLSTVQFASTRLVSIVESALKVSGLNPSRLELEITETVMLRDTEATLATMHRLKALGVSIALDDFGSGYSSLGYLQRFPFNKVKIDKSFVSNIEEKGTSGAIVRAIIDLCFALNMTTTAEGVETEEQYRILTALGCTEAQGYLLGQPIPLGTFAVTGQRV